jgi:hypothetical protein
MPGAKMFRIFTRKSLPAAGGQGYLFRLAYA